MRVQQVSITTGFDTIIYKGHIELDENVVHDLGLQELPSDSKPIVFGYYENSHTVVALPGTDWDTMVDHLIEAVQKMYKHRKHHKNIQRIKQLKVGGFVELYE